MFHLSPRSEARLQGVHPVLVKVVKRALELSEVDFAVVDGLRTEEQQRKLVEKGASKTMKSKHLLQEDGWGHAVDLVPYIDGRIVWEIIPCSLIAEAMRQAANEFGLTLRWGGCWAIITNNQRPMMDMMNEYVDHKRAAGRHPFIDGPHFEIR